MVPIAFGAGRDWNIEDVELFNDSLRHWLVDHTTLARLDAHIQPS